MLRGESALAPGVYIYICIYLYIAGPCCRLIPAMRSACLPKSLPLNSFIRAVTACEVHVARVLAVFVLAQTISNSFNILLRAAACYPFLRRQWLKRNLVRTSLGLAFPHTRPPHPCGGLFHKGACFTPVPLLDRLLSCTRLTAEKNSQTGVVL